MNVKKNLVAVVLLVAVGVGSVFAATPVYLSTSVKGLGTPIMPVTVDTPQEIIDWFADHGMDTGSVGTTLESMPVAYRNKLRDLYADDDYQAELRQLAANVLKPYLSEGSVETVSTTYGPFTWTVSYNKEIDEEL